MKFETKKINDLSTGKVRHWSIVLEKINELIDAKVYVYVYWRRLRYEIISRLSSIRNEVN